MSSPATTPATFDREARHRFVRVIRNFLTSDVRLAARLLLGTLVMLLLAISGLNVLNSYVGRDFMTAVEHRDMPGFVRMAGLYAGVFVLSTVVAVMYRFVEERLGLLWREWLTRRLLGFYLADQSYHWLKVDGVITNPDQRIAEDVRVFTTTTLSLLLMVLNGILTVLAFGGVLWAINHLLFAVAIGYAAVGSLLTVLFGRSLIGLNYAQADREANFRAELIHLREHSEAVALQRHEPHLDARLRSHFGALTANVRRIIAVNRNLGFFTTGYNFFIQLVPTLIVAPLFIRGEIEFGVITQSAMAFSHLMGAFSLIVTQFPAISSQAAVVARLSRLAAHWEPSGPPTSGIEMVPCEDGIAYEGVTLRAREDVRVLVSALTVAVPPGARVLVRGPNDAAKAALLRATAGLWSAGVGRICRPGLEAVAFVTERPYVPPGTLRDLLAAGAATDGAIAETLDALGLGTLAERAGGLDVERDWSHLLALDEQQLLSIARVILARPRIVFLERIDTTLGDEQIERVLTHLERGRSGWVLLSGGVEPSTAEWVLDLAESGAWTWQPRAA